MLATIDACVEDEEEGESTATTVPATAEAPMEVELEVAEVPAEVHAAVGADVSEHVTGVPADEGVGEIAADPVLGVAAPEVPAPKGAPPMHTGGGDEVVNVQVGLRVNALTGLVGVKLGFQAEVEEPPAPPPPKEPAAPPPPEHKWEDLSVRKRAVVNGNAGVVFLLSDDGNTLGFCYDDSQRLWETMPRPQFMKQAVPEGVLPKGAVGYVLKGPHAGAGSDADSLAGGGGGSANRAVCAVLTDCVYIFDGKWEAYLNYKPLYCPIEELCLLWQTPMVRRRLVSRSRLMRRTCAHPPMISAARGQNTAPTEPTTAILLAVMLGTELNKKKNMPEVRRWSLVRTPKHGDCWVRLKGMERTLPFPGHTPITLVEIRSALHCAVSARLPSTVHGHAKAPKVPRTAAPGTPQTPANGDAPALRPRGSGNKTGTNELGTNAARWGVATVQAMSLDQLQSVRATPHQPHPLR